MTKSRVSTVSGSLRSLISRRTLGRDIGALLVGLLPIDVRHAATVASQPQAPAGQALNLEDTAVWDDAFCQVCNQAGCTSDVGCQQPSAPAHDPPTLVPTANTDGRVLRLSNLGGPSYAHVLYQCRLGEDEYPGVIAATSFALDLWFLCEPPTTINNADGVLSRVQAIEFAIGLWAGSSQWDWEVQWDVVPGPGRTASWKVYGDHVWVPTGIPAELTSGDWHHLHLRGSVVNGQTHYDTFAIDGVEHTLGLSYPPRHLDVPSQPPLVTVHVQLDGPVYPVAGGYEVFLDRVNLHWSDSASGTSPSRTSASSTMMPPTTNAIDAGNSTACGPLQPSREIGLNTYQGLQLPLPAPAGPCELYLAHGDLLANGTCHVQVFSPGELISGLSSSTWKLVLVSGGTDEQRQQEAARIQAGAAQAAGGQCPFG
jgi:hypothetical protein